MIKVTHPHEQLRVENIILYLYSLPSMWKSSIAMTAENALLMNFDKGAHRVNPTLRRSTIMHIDTWRDVQGMAAPDIAPYSTVIIDTAGTMQECARAFVAEEKKNVSGNGVLKQQAQGIANTHLNRFLRNLIAWKKDIVFLAHAIEDKDNQDRPIIRPDLGGRSRQELYRLSDCMALLTFEQRHQHLQRVLQFTANQDHLAKDCANLGSVDVPDLFTHPHFLADLITHVKVTLNTMTPEQVERMKVHQEAALWASKCNEARTLKDFNELMGELQIAKEQKHPQRLDMWNTLKPYAINLGFIFDSTSATWLESA